jgi:hypothetical protein
VIDYAKIGKDIGELVCEKQAAAVGRDGHKVTTSCPRPQRERVVGAYCAVPSPRC